MALLTVITGTTHGIGRSTAIELARAGHRVVMLCRNAVLAEALAGQIRAQAPDAGIEAIECDLASLDSVRRAAALVRQRHPVIHRLILNAGMAGTRVLRNATGMDLNFAVNHLGHFLLTEQLRGCMAAQGRIITVASWAHFRARLDLDAVADPRERIGAMASYARSKLANVMHSLALARQLQGSGVTASCLHPGVVATNLLPGWVKVLQRLARGPLFDDVRGARTTLHLALAQDVVDINGKYFDENSLPRPASAIAQDMRLQDALWQRSLEWAR